MHLDTSELRVCGALIRPSTTVRDLGVLLESDLSMRRHVAWTAGCCSSSVSPGAASSRCLLGLRRRLLPLLSLRGWTATTACSSLCSMLQRGSSATGGSMTTSRLFFVMFSTGCQSHSASSTSSVYSSFNHYTELPPSICEIAALQLIPPLRLRLFERTDRRVRRMRTHLGDCAFSAAGPRCWNSLQPVIHFADSVDSFKAQLKINLFANAYTQCSCL